jgi:hypothetical protein
MNNIIDNLQDHKAMKAMADALEISHSHLLVDNHGKFALRGRDRKPMKMIQCGKGCYIYYIKAPSIRKCSAIRRKLIAFGMSVELQKDEVVYFSMRRLPEPDESKYIRQLLGYKPKRSLQLQNSDIP